MSESEQSYGWTTLNVMPWVRHEQQKGGRTVFVLLAKGKGKTDGPH